MKTTFVSFIACGLLAGFWYLADSDELDANGSDHTITSPGSVKRKPDAGSLEGAVPSSVPLIILPKHDDLQSTVKALTSTGRAADQYGAYLQIKACVDFEREKTFFALGRADERNGTLPDGIHQATVREVESMTEYCGVLTETMRRSRLDFLSIAAKAGVPDADISYVTEGPFGDPTALLSRPDDPLVVEWKERALAIVTTNAEKGMLPSLKLLQIGMSAGLSPFPQDKVMADAYRRVTVTSFSASGHLKPSRGQLSKQFWEINPNLTNLENARAIAEAQEIERKIELYSARSY